MRLSTKTSEFCLWFSTFRQGSPNTVDSYGTAFAQFQGFVLSRGLTDDMRHFTADTVQAFAEHLTAAGASAVTVRIRLAALASFAKWAMRQRDERGRYVLAENPMERVERPRRGPVRERPFLLGDELRALLTVACEPYQALVRDVLIDTGIRASEVCNATVADFQGTTFQVRLKGGRDTTVVLSPDVVDRLKDALLARGVPDGAEPLLVNGEGRRWSRTSLGQMLVRLGRKAGVTRTQVRPHLLRHTFSVLARQAGLDVAVRAKLLNHASTATLARYEHTLGAELVAAHDAVRVARQVYTGN